ncbi:hypothetical protein GCM10010116_10900 [Microbispora rosea subsp. aerata]|nr:hypothetical protein GCM10010116_10900 [Microbispora rosea subsp. aerata]GIH57276.1 hypothetical protein Mro02_41900 [Microbispora rosea subsp. aerata]GLJ83417.1 hypothetical protein GCM10017588_21450 [Microbispora rosea subsp. aerata]
MNRPATAGRLIHVRVRSIFVAAAVCAGAVLAACAPTAVPDGCPGRWGGEGIGGWVPAAADVEGADESLVPGTPVRALIRLRAERRQRPAPGRGGRRRSSADGPAGPLKRQ